MAALLSRGCVLPATLSNRAEAPRKSVASRRSICRGALFVRDVNLLTRPHHARRTLHRRAMQERYVSHLFSLLVLLLSGCICVTWAVRRSVPPSRCRQGVGSSSLLLADLVAWCLDGVHTAASCLLYIFRDANRFAYSKVPTPPGPMRCREPRCALHQLRRLSDRVPHPLAQAKEAAGRQRGTVERLGQVCLEGLSLWRRPRPFRRLLA